MPTNLLADIRNGRSLRKVEQTERKEAGASVAPAGGGGGQANLMAAIQGGVKLRSTAQRPASEVPKRPVSQQESMLAAIRGGVALRKTEGGGGPKAKQRPAPDKMESAMMSALATIRFATHGSDESDAEKSEWDEDDSSSSDDE